MSLVRLVCLLMFLVQFSTAATPAPKAVGTFSVDEAVVLAAESVREIKAESLGTFRELQDGTRVLVLRVRRAGAASMRLHLGGMRLPEGARLFVYGISNGAAIDTAGPWESSGPSADGSFWTPAIRGSEVILELQADRELPSDLPFEIIETEAAEAAPAVTSTPQPVASREIRTSLYRGVAVTHEMTDGLGVLEGDIILGEESELRSADRKSQGRSAVAITGLSFRWPNGIIPYAVDPLIVNPARVEAAVNHWNTKMAGVVKMIPRTTETNHVKFVRASSSTQCASYVGMNRGQQPIYTGDSCSTGNLIHEIGHAFGLWHEQSREDRNKYVKIKWENIKVGYEYNFEQNIFDGDDVNGYDYASIMHYPVNSFSKNGQPTMETIPAGIAIGQRSALSAGDIAAILKLYPPPPVAPAVAPTSTAAPSNVTVTVATSHTGVQMRVDGVLYTTSQTFNWPAGSTHSIEAIDTIPPSSGTKYVFTGWSDLGARLHTVTPSSAVTYTATFAVKYITSLSVYPAEAGTATVLSASADKYYPVGTTVNLVAVAAPGYCFSAWGELVRGTPAATPLTLVKPYWLRASFIAGSITLLPGAATAPAAGGSLTLAVSATTGCLWDARSDAPWLTVVTGKSGTGPLTVTYSVAPNTTGLPRTGTINVNGNVHVVNQL